MDDEYTKTEARQGRRGLPVLVVLVVALILAAVAWWGAEIYGMIIDPSPSEEISMFDGKVISSGIANVS